MHPYHQPLFVEFIVYFNENQDYFECHEVLEELWKSLPNRDKNHPMTAFILLATGMYHWRRGNIAGARRTIQKAVSKFLTFEVLYPVYTTDIDFTHFLLDVQKVLKLITEELPFELFTIHIQSRHLASIVTTATSSMVLLRTGSDDVLHKHMLRDRSDILKEREEKKKGRH